MARCCCGGLLLQTVDYDECKSCRDWYGCRGDCGRYYTRVDRCPVTGMTSRCSSSGEDCCLRAAELKKAEREAKEAEREKEQRRQKAERVKEQRRQQAERIADFRRRWRVSSPGEKLGFYGKSKLLVLARRYALKGRSSLTVEELIRTLKPIVVRTDFPIR